MLNQVRNYITKLLIWLILKLKFGKNMWDRIGGFVFFNLIFQIRF